ncbi:transporter substrate-binding domain-containing protein [Aestuariibacter halophilus]|uniref:Transporter substrate-binding domain-containing protein n=1 Tax=Fluctibacter halophilus TaxID=226011 RepID=A0ABS8GC89_9ALTE|nr:transporter substrate-binding domain-containing protein [Aestuariibacter halophilus]MCC2618019.1 transporter substrate-binding domain-containing protein [Aestuariibacter halophilus]
MAIFRCLAFLLISFSSAAQGQQKPIIYLYTYHDKPPFVVDLAARTGLYFDLAQRFNQLSEHYQFVTAYVPRKRLDVMIEQGRIDGVVLGANPLWFGDADQTRFFWLPPYFADQDEFVSLARQPFEYQGPESFVNTTVAAVAGYYYKGVNEAVSRGAALRIDTVSEESVLTLVKKGRADVGLVSRSVFKYLRRHDRVDDIYHFSAIPHDRFERQAFMPREDVIRCEALNRLFSRVLQDGSWSALVARYQ